METKLERTPSPIITLLGLWLHEMRAALLERLPGPEDEAVIRSRLAALAGGCEGERGRRGDGATGRGNDLVSQPAVDAALALWRVVHSVLERGVDLSGDDTEALALIADALGAGGEAELDVASLQELARGFLAPEGGWPLTPEAFAARVRQQPPARLGLPDGVELAGASLAGFLESAHFPFGWYRVGDERFFVTPSLRLDAALLESLVRPGPGERPVGRELLVWQRASFRVAAGTASDIRDARPFVGPSGARAYLWLGPVLPGGPLVIRDANNVETRIAVPEVLLAADGDATGITTETQRHGEEGEGGPGVQAFRRSGVQESPAAHLIASSAARPLGARQIIAPAHPALGRAEEALRRGEDRAVVESHLREIMRSVGASGETLAGAGRLWQALGRADVASAAFTMALERGSVEGALGLSRLAEARGEGLEAAARPLDAAVARNLRSPELHARYVELLERLRHGWSSGPLGEWHRRQAEELTRGEK